VLAQRPTDHAPYTCYAPEAVWSVWNRPAAPHGPAGVPEAQTRTDPGQDPALAGLCLFLQLFFNRLYADKFAMLLGKFDSAKIGNKISSV